MRSPMWRISTVVLATLAACGGGTEPEHEHEDRPGLTVSSGAGITDTIEAEVSEPLVVELRDSIGEPIAGQRIVFEPKDCVGDSCPVLLAPVGGTEYVLAVEDTTDAQGRASVQVKLSYVVGGAVVRVAAPDRGLVTTATYVVLPGQPYSVGRDPRDTTLYVGGHYLLRPITRDRAFNPRENDDVTFTWLDGPITVDEEGVVTANAIGRGRIIARIGSLSDTSYVSVVPPGRIAATWFNYDTTEVRTIELDGSGLQTVSPSGSSQGGYPSWSPTGEIVFVMGGRGTFSRLVMATPFGLRRLLEELPQDEQHPRVSREGWTYFQTAGDLIVGGEIWRVHLDSGTLERVGPPGDPNFSDGDPDPSPDGNAFAYITSRPDGVTRIVVRDLSTGVDHPLGVEGFRPRWSPTGDWIAYARDAFFGEGTIRVVRPDGSDDHQLSLPGYGYQIRGLDWSPDGAWLIARVDGPGFDYLGPLVLINAATGVPLPLGWSHQYHWPAWKPE